MSQYCTCTGIESDVQNNNRSSGMLGAMPDIGRSSDPTGYLNHIDENSSARQGENGINSLLKYCTRYTT